MAIEIKVSFYSQKPADDNKGYGGHQFSSREEDVHKWPCAFYTYIALIKMEIKLYL